MVMIQGLEMARVMIQTSTSRGCWWTDGHSDSSSRIRQVDEAQDHHSIPRVVALLVMLVGLPRSTTLRSGIYIHYSGYDTTVSV